MDFKETEFVFNFFSGSGPTLIAFCPSGSEQPVASNMKQALARYQLEAEALALDLAIQTEPY